MARDAPQVSVGGLFGLGIAGHNSCRIMPKYGRRVQRRRERSYNEGSSIKGKGRVMRHNKESKEEYIEKAWDEEAASF